jgi:hypothetical protein
VVLRWCFAPTGQLQATLVDVHDVKLTVHKYTFENDLMEAELPKCTLADEINAATCCRHLIRIRSQYEEGSHS